MSSCIILTFYKATILSILGYGIIVWSGNLTAKIRTHVNNLMRVEGKTLSLCIMQQANNIVSDFSHVLFLEYELMNSGRRYRVPLCKYNRYKYYFVPFLIKLINEQLW